MDREETLALYEKAQKEGAHVWNAWATKMLAEKKRLKETGEWKTKRKDWEERATADFSSIAIPHRFKDWVNFDNFIFPAHTSFSKASFDHLTSFKSTKFHGEVDFLYSHFGDIAVFDSAAFLEKARFHEAIFCNLTKFESCIFYKETNFSDTKFNGSTLFRFSIFYGPADFSQSVSQKMIGLDDTLFQRIAFFNAFRSNGGLLLNLANFKTKVPDFTQAHFEEAPRLDDIQICPPPKLSPRYPWSRYFWAKKLGRAYKAYEERLYNRWIKYPWSQLSNTHHDPEDEAKYRALKRLAIQAHDHENEQKFWAREIRARRHIKDFMFPWKAGLASSFRYWGGVLYGLVSDYGRSIWRPVAFSALLVYAMTCVHINNHEALKNQQITQETARLKYPASTVTDCNAAWAAFLVSLKTSSLGLGFDRTKSDIYKDHYRCLYPSEKASLNIPDKILIYEFLQLLGSAILIFLALLGIRNNFKLK